MKWISSPAWRFVFVAVFSLALASCGNNNNGGGNPPGNPTPPPTTGNNNNNNNNNNNTTTPPKITQGIHVYTSLCGLPNGCPANETPYQLILTVEFQRPNGWILLGEVDSGQLGEFTIGVDPGNYRLKAKDPQPSAVTPATGAEADVTVEADKVAEVKMQFTPK